MTVRKIAVVTRAAITDVPNAEIFRLTDHVSQLHAKLARHGPWDVLVDEVGGIGGVVRLKELLFHVRPGGHFIVQLTGTDEGSRTSRQRIAALLSQLEDITDPVVPQWGGDKRPNEERDLQALAASLVSAEPIEYGWRIRHRADVLPKLRESETVGWADVLDTVPGQDWPAQLSYRTSSPHPLNPAPPEYAAPELQLRSWSEVAATPGCAVFTDRCVLPDSYPQGPGRRQRTPYLVDWARTFALRPDWPRRRLPGTWFHLDNEFRQHFGHAVTEQVAHLWGWPAAGELGAKALMFGPPLAPWERELFALGGLDPVDVVTLEEPVVVERLITASPMYRRPDYVHPRLRDTYETIGRAALARSTVEPVEKVFLSRSPTTRRCHNADEVEARFVAAGFRVVLPETMPVADQIALVRQARTVGGFAGSNLFHIAFAGEPKHVIALTSESYPAHNEYMMSALLGHRLDMVVCPPDIPRIGGFTEESFHSDYTFDATRDGAFLDQALAES